MSVPNYTDVYAIPGQHSIIDVINPDTGLTWVNGHTEAQIKEREPLAVRMTWADWQTAQSLTQRTPITWQPSTEETYHEMLEVLPPALWIGGAFLVGEPDDHDVLTGEPRYAAYWKRGLSEDTARYSVASRPLTCRELRAILRG